MKQKISLHDLWNRVRERDNRRAAARSRGIKTGEISPRFLLTVYDKEGNEYPGEVVKALTAVEQTRTCTHSRHGRERIKNTSRLVPDGFKILTVGGTIVCDMHGRSGGVVLCDHEGNRLKALELHVRNYALVDIVVSGKLALTRVDDSAPGHIVRLAAKDDPDLRETVEQALEANRSLL